MNGNTPVIGTNVRSLKKELEEIGKIAVGKVPVFVRLSEEALRRKSVQVKDTHTELPLEKPKKRTQTQEYAQSLATRLINEGKRRQEELEQKRKHRDLAEAREVQAILSKKHPKRPRNQEVYNRLIQETKIIEQCYGKPGKPNIH